MPLPPPGRRRGPQAVLERLTECCSCPRALLISLVATVLILVFRPTALPSSASSFVLGSGAVATHPPAFGKALFVGQKTGSTSVADAFQRLGYRVQHATDWSKMPCCERLGSDEVFAGTAYLRVDWLEKFVEAFPGEPGESVRAKVIFLDREVDSHVESYLAHKRNRGINFSRNESVAHIRDMRERADEARQWLDAHGIKHITVDVIKDSDDAAKRVSAILELPGGGITLPHANHGKSIVEASIFRATHTIKSRRGKGSKGSGRGRGRRGLREQRQRAGRGREGSWEKNETSGGEGGGGSGRGRGAADGRRRESGRANSKYGGGIQGRERRLSKRAEVK